MDTLLIHGGSHGAWCWTDVIAAMAARGAVATAFDLPGAGADPTPRKGLTLADSIARVIEHVDGSGADPVRLVAHSIAGFVVAPVVAARPGRIAEIVLVAAVTLHPGQRGIDTIPQQRRGSYYDLAAASTDNTLMGSFESVRNRFFTDLSDESAALAFAQLTPQPFEPYLEPARFGAAGMGLPLRYLAAADDHNFDASTTAAFAAKAGVMTERIPGDHCAMLSAPVGLAAAITGTD